jgi:hypothetical protein
MKDRILFWCDRKFTTFGIAHSLQKQYDCDLFGIFQLTDKTKDVFREQQLVKFKQVWIFNDYVSKENQNYDLKYLKSFEEKYKINLWKIPYTDAFLGSNAYHKFTGNEVLSLFTQECKFFEKILDEIKPDFLIIRSYDNQDTRILYELCKARGIKILMLVVTRFDLRYKIADEEDYIDDYTKDTFTSNDPSIENNLKILSASSSKRFNKLIEYRKTKAQKNFKDSLCSLLFGNNDKYSFLNHGKTVPKVIFYFLSSKLKKKYRSSFIDRNCTSEINDDEKFIYFPLHYEPERLLFVQAPLYTNQLEVITNIAKSLPIDYKLYVKEHPAMSVKNWRPTSYYKQILDLPNVRLVHTSADYKEIIDKCSLVVTIAGSSGLEAVFHNKPTIVFADVSYSSLPSVYRLKNYEELPQAILESLEKKVNPSDLNKFINYTFKNSFEYDYLNPFLEVDEFHDKGVLQNNPLLIKNIEDCLEKNKDVFDSLGLEHVKKINELKQIS